MSNTYETKPNTGSLFRNDKKETDSHPDYKGSALIDGTEYWLSAWINEAKSGQKYMSLKMQPKDEQKPTASMMSGKQLKAAKSDAWVDEPLDAPPF